MIIYEENPSSIGLEIAALILLNAGFFPLVNATVGLLRLMSVCQFYGLGIRLILYQCHTRYERLKNIPALPCLSSDFCRWYRPHHRWGLNYCQKPSDGARADQIGVYNHVVSPRLSRFHSGTLLAFTGVALLGEHQGKHFFGAMNIWHDQALNRIPAF